EIFIEFCRHLDQNYEKRTKQFGLKEKIIKKIHKLAEKSVSRKKKVKGKCACCFGLKFVL
ncbi:hypothetical protein P7M08_24530, partial [Vibrio parahaemolyticus]|nr:hypothetical protein [Vibrio parahaemolyticus]